MIGQIDMFGKEHNTTPIHTEVSDILSRFPASRTNPHLFGRLFLKKRLDLPTEKLDSVVDAAHEFLTADRERRRQNEADEAAKI